MTEPRLSDEIDETSDHAVDDASDVVGRVAEEFAERCRRGESPSVDEYVRRYPEHSSKIRDLLPSVAMMERLKRRVRASVDPAAEPPEPAPERLGEYRIVRELGRGGMGIVYEAFQESLGRHVALKVIPRQGLLEGKRRRRFQREAMAVAQLHHTNIVPIFAAGEHDGLPYYAMQYIGGSGLDRMLDAWRRQGPERGPGHWRFVARVGIQAAEALQYAHGQGIMHRDIKPANVLIDEHQVAWITDFGLAKLAGRDDLTNSGDVVGTLRYLAPEALSGQNDRRGDIYSLGLTLYELLTLRQPFGDLSPSELLRCVTEEQPTRPRKLDSTIPLDLETIVLKATAREPDHRYATAGELADDLRAFLDDRPIRARRASPPERLARWCRRNKMLAGVSAFAAASFLLALVFATVGYVTTHRALQKSDANVKSALDAFEKLFNEFDDPMDAGPFADRVPPDLALSRPPGDEPRGPGKRQAHALKRAMPGIPGLGPTPTPPHHPPEDPSRPPRGPMMFGKMNLSPRELALLEIVLDYYDGFAEQNETNAQLPGEAARAYRKVAGLYRILGREPEADKAQARAVARFESLIRRYGEDSEYTYDLARTLAHDGPASYAVPAERAEPDLRLAIAMVERGFERAADRKRIMYAAALARWKARLAEHLEALGRAEEALGAYRESIAHDEWLADQLSDRSMVEEVVSLHRAALASRLIGLGRGQEAGPLLDRAASDINKLLDENARLMPGADERLCGGLESLASSYRSLGEQQRAAELAAAADRIRERGHDRRPGHPGGGGPGSGRKGPPGAGRGRSPGPPTGPPGA